MPVLPRPLYTNKHLNDNVRKHIVEYAPSEDLDQLPYSEKGYA